MAYKLTDLAPALRARVEQAIGTAPAGPVKPISKRRAMSKTERDYLVYVLGGAAMYEPVTLRLPGGSRYTPDFMRVHDGIIELHEVKGTYRLGSHGRARTAFCEAAAAFPMFRFLWAERLENGGWTQKEWRMA